MTTTTERKSNNSYIIVFCTPIWEECNCHTELTIGVSLFLDLVVPAVEILQIVHGPSQVQCIFGLAYIFNQINQSNYKI